MCVWLHFLIIIFLRFIHVFCYLFLLDVYSFVHFPVSGYLSCVQFLAVLNKAAMNIFVWVFFCRFVFLFFLGKFRGSRMELLNHGFCLTLRETAIYFQSDCNILCKRFVQRVPVALHLCQRLMLLDYPLTILVGVWWYLTVILVTLTTNGCWTYFMCLMTLPLLFLKLIYNL